MPELTITSPFVHFRVDSKTFTMSSPNARVDLNPLPESTLSSRQGIRICPLAINPDLQTPESPTRPEAVCLNIDEKLAEKSLVRKAGFSTNVLGNG